MMKTIQNKLCATFAAYRENIAIDYRNSRVTYEEADRKSNQVANFLLQKGVGKGTFVGILLDDKADLIISILGVLKAGAAFLPLDSSYPLERLRVMVDSTDTGLVITEARHDGLFAGAESVLYDRMLEESPVLPEGAERDVDPNDPVYVYFTSGTTGTPKAIVGRNKGLLHFVEWEIGTFSVTSSTRVSQLTSQCHDPYLRDVFVPLCAGGTVCIPDGRETLLDPAQLAGWVEQAMVDLIHCTPSLFQQMAAGVKSADAFPQVRAILLAGEKIIPASLSNWYETFGSRIQLVNIYGPTETTLAKLFYLIQPADANRERIPLGTAIKGARAIILDDQMKICGEGVAGELYIRTPYRSLGYYRNDELNREKFLVNPYNNDPSDLLYRTGDLARTLSDGTIEFLGRMDRQVKIRGYRIEIAEIENAILKMSGVAETAVVAREKANGELYLCAYLVLAEARGEEAAVQAVRSHLEACLPDYMIPQHIVPIDKMPLTPNGKLDEKALPEPAATEYAEPQGDVEQKLAAIWCDIFGVERVGRHDRFFSLGGHSLNVMSLISNVYQTFEVELSLGEVFQNLSLEELAALISRAAKSEYVAIEPVGPREHYALSSAQKSQFILNQLETDSLSYNAPKVICVTGPFDAARCEASFAALIDRHETLRTSFAVVNGQPVQRVHDSVEFSIARFDGAGRDIDEFIESFAKPFDLEKPPLLRVWLVKASAEEHWLMFDVHHIISDGVSLAILLTEFIELYKGSTLPPLRLQYKDYCEWQQKFFETKAFEQQEAYWLRTFAGDVPVLEMPTDWPRQQKPNFEGRQLTFALPDDVTQLLRERVQETGSTLNTFLLTLYYAFLFKCTGQEDATVGTAIAGRPHPDLSNIIGMFVNTLGMRNFPAGRKRFVDLLEEVKTNAIEAYENQDYPFEKLVGNLPIRREQGRNPLFDTMFIMQNVEFPETRIDDITLSVHEIPNHTSKFDFKLDAFDFEGVITCTLEYNTSLFEAATAEHWVEIFQRITAAVVRDVELPLGDIEIVSEEDKQMMMGFASDFNF